MPSGSGTRRPNGYFKTVRLGRGWVNLQYGAIWGTLQLLLQLLWTFPYATSTQDSHSLSYYTMQMQSYQWKLLWSLRMNANKIIQWRIINGTERETLRYSLWDMWISLKLFLNQLNAWINRKLVSGEVPNFGQCCQERTQQSPVHYIDYFASRQMRENLMTFQIIDWNLGMSHESDSV